MAGKGSSHLIFPQNFLQWKNSHYVDVLVETPLSKQETDLLYVQTVMVK